MKIVGLWIDHHEAVIVTVGEEGAIVKRFESRVAVSRPSFFDEIENYIETAERIFVMGPDAGKAEFVRHIGKSRAMLGRVAGVESRDRMTESQIVDAVKAFYGHPVI